jgi:DNA-binding LytR/AlgR family response regulator
MQILIVEDEPLAAERLGQMVHSYPGRSLTVGHWADSLRAATAYLDAHNPDLMLLDIQLGDGLSFDIFEKTTVRAPVIFTTAFDQYALRAFKVNSIDYILKPIQREELYRAFDRFFERNGVTTPLNGEIMALLGSMVRKEYKTRFLVKIGDKLLTIPVDRISYFYVEDRVLLLRAREGHTYTLGYTLEQLEMMLDPAVFFRINRACFVCIGAILEVVPYHGNRLELMPQGRHTKEAFVVSRELCGAFKRWLGD